MAKVVISSISREAQQVQQTIVAQAAAFHYDDHQIFALRLALDEALSNAIKHGNANNPTKKVFVDFTIDHNHIEISICDEGPGFKPEALPDPTAEENLELPNGRGVMLIKAYMTSVSYNDKGNCVTMIKRKDCRLPQM
jgi:serine/threonine-protein kinase RsbW